MRSRWTLCTCWKCLCVADYAPSAVNLQVRAACGWGGGTKDSIRARSENTPHYSCEVWGNGGHLTCKCTRGSTGVCGRYTSLVISLHLYWKPGPRNKLLVVCRRKLELLLLFYQENVCRGPAGKSAPEKWLEECKRTHQSVWLQQGGSVWRPSVWGPAVDLWKPSLFWQQPPALLHSWSGASRPACHSGSFTVRPK